MNNRLTDEHQDLLVVEALGVADVREQEQQPPSPQSLVPPTGAETNAKGNASFTENNQAQQEAAAQQLARKLNDAAAQLAFTVDAVTPAPEIRRRIMAAIGATSETSSDNTNPAVAAAIASAARHTANSDADAATLAPGSGSSNVVAMTARRNIFTMSRATLTYSAIAASLALVALAGLSFVLWRRAADAQAQVARANTEITRLTAEAEKLKTELAESQNETELIAAPQTKLAVLNGTDKAPAASARLVFDPQTKRAVLYINRLPPAPAGKTYQLWYIADGKPLSGAIFTTVEQGSLRDVAPAGSGTASTFAITIEQAGGSPTPKGDKVLVGTSSGSGVS